MKTKKTKLKLMNFKATETQIATMKKIAKLRYNGNVGGMIRSICADPRLLKTNRIRVKKAA